ncbi:MAG: hypothetical protein P8M78_06440 [Myxococcota bacterium]|nr:hypothetical protein [Myxococcota bacterium]
MSRSLLLGCAAIGALIAGFVPLSALAERGGKLSYYGAIDPSPVDNEAEAKDSAGGDCAWLDSRFETFAGVPVPVTVTAQPQWEIGFDEIRSATIHEAIPSPGITGSRSYVFVHLKVGEKAKNRIDALKKARCGTFVRVQHDDRDLALARIVGLEPGVLPGGSFGSREEAERFYGAIEERVSFVALSDENRAYWQTRNDELIEMALWYAKCDHDYLKGLGDSLYEHIMTTPSLRERSGRANCDEEPPQVPLNSTASGSVDRLSEKSP